jgi:hypothetical protein
VENTWSRKVSVVSAACWWRCWNAVQSCDACLIALSDSVGHTSGPMSELVYKP